MARKEHTFHYIYKITCLKNNKYYIGMHSTSNIDDGYSGGGKRIKRSIKKHGKENHIKDILEYLPDRKSLIEREVQLINEELLRDPLCMNIMTGGSGGAQLPEIQKLWWRSANIARVNKWYNDEEFRNKHREDLKMWGAKGNELLSNGTYPASMGFLNKKHSEDSKLKIGRSNSKSQKGIKNSQYNTCWVIKEGISLKIKVERLNEYILDGWRRGRK